MGKITTKTAQKQAATEKKTAPKQVVTSTEGLAKVGQEAYQDASEEAKKAAAEAKAKEQERDLQDREKLKEGTVPYGSEESERPEENPYAEGLGEAFWDVFGNDLTSSNRKVNTRCEEAKARVKKTEVWYKSFGVGYFVIMLLFLIMIVYNIYQGTYMHIVSNLLRMLCITVIEITSYTRTKFSNNLICENFDNIRDKDKAEIQVTAHQAFLRMLGKALKEKGLGVCPKK